MRWCIESPTQLPIDDMLEDLSFGFEGFWGLMLFRPAG
jgi:hypothetical protein